MHIHIYIHIHIHGRKSTARKSAEGKNKERRGVEKEKKKNAAPGAEMIGGIPAERTELAALLEHRVEQHQRCQQLLRSQDLYLCTRKASKLSSNLRRCKQLLRCQDFYFCPGKASIVRTCQQRLPLARPAAALPCLLAYHLHTSAYVRIRPHTSTYVNTRQHTSAYVSIRQHTSAQLI